MATETRANYRLGTLYSLATALLLAMQSPFSALAAKSLSSPLFVCFTQVALLASVPLLIRREESRRDFAAVLFDAGNIGKLAALFLIGVAGLLLYNIGLSGANPIITAAIMNLSPFWAALVAFLVSRKSIPTSPLIFCGCFIVAFVGAMTIAWSQLDTAQLSDLGRFARRHFAQQVDLRDTHADIFCPERDSRIQMVPRIRRIRGHRARIS